MDRVSAGFERNVPTVVMTRPPLMSGNRMMEDATAVMCGCKEAEDLVVLRLVRDSSESTRTNLPLRTMFLALLTSHSESGP